MINRRLMTFLILALFGVACGVKAAPYPAAAILPQKVRQLTQTVTKEGELILSWLPPEVNMTGRPLTALGGFQIEMADHLADEHYCSDCPPLYQSEPVDRLPARTPPSGRNIDSEPYEWRHQLEPGHVYYFRVAAVHENGGVHPEAKTETVVWALARPETMKFRAALRDGAVELSWARPSPELRVELEKRSADGPWQPLPGLDQAANRHLDLEVANDLVYSYRGRFLKVKGETRTQGAWSEEVEIRILSQVTSEEANERRPSPAADVYGDRSPDEEPVQPDRN
jgi:hypothetical protein